MFIISLSRALCTSRCRARGGFPANCLLTTDTSKLVPQPHGESGKANTTVTRQLVE